MKPASKVVLRAAAGQVMSERPPEPETLDTYVVARKSLRQWLGWLNTHPDTGEDLTHHRTPGSRYGRTGGETAYFALAAALVYVELVGFGGDKEEFEISLGTYQHLAVNDRPEVAEMIADSWYVVPQCIRDVIGEEADVRGLYD